ncbi:hypothetical protein NR800_12035 [Corallococcus interemptor]
MAWKNQLHRLRVRDDVHFGFLVLGCCVMLYVASVLAFVGS